jgi:DNA processing protein
MDLIEAQLRLGRARGLNPASLGALVSAPAPKQRADLLALCEQSPMLRAALLGVEQARVQADRRWVEQHGIGLLDITSQRYPPLLLTIHRAPALLYVRGSLTALDGAQLAIVGSRRPTATGRLIAFEFAAQLSQAGLTITSGLALGIDAAAHEGALSVGGKTIAVLGSGLDDVYPAEHRTLAARIAACGALLSEFPPATPARPSNFPRRNRIISGLARGLLVVEAALGSGSLITARSASREGRALFAIPGSIRNPLARGCHELIRRGATLVECPAQILAELQINTPKQMLMTFEQGGLKFPAGRRRLDKAYELLLDAIGFEPSGLDVLVDRTGLPSQSVASMLLILELEGAVGRQVDGQYVRL